MRELACRIECGVSLPSKAVFLERVATVSSHDRIRRQQLVVQAEGYLELGMPRHALDVLARYGDPESLPDHALYLQGESLRALGQFREAVEPLSRAAQGNPDRHPHLAGAGLVPQADRPDRPGHRIVGRSAGREPNDALVHYNLACYWSVANNKRQALAYLSRLFDLKDHYRSLVGPEPDFDAIRSDPAFQALVRVTV